jgi:molybdopterin converting factor small subunit
MVFIPGMLRPLAGGATSLEVPGATLRELVAELVRIHPGLDGRIVDENGARPEVFLAINGEESFSLDQAVPAGAEVHIMPAIAGG